MAKREFPKLGAQEPDIDELKEQINLLKRSSVVDMPLSTIIIKKNVRTVFDDKSIDEMADSIKEFGQLQPIVVYPYGASYIVKVGERRVRACMKLGYSTIKAIIDVQEKSEDQITIEQLIENIQREDLGPADLENSVSLIVKQVGSNREAAKILKKDESWITRALQADKVRQSLESSGVDTASMGTRQLAELSGVAKKDLPQVVKKAQEEGGGTVESYAKAAGKKVKNEISIKILLDPDSYTIKSTGTASDSEILGKIKKYLESLIPSPNRNDSEEKKKKKNVSAPVADDSEIEDPLNEA